MVKLFFTLYYLDTNSYADSYDKNGNSKFMKDAKRTVDMSVDFHAKHVRRKDWQNPRHVNNVQNCHCSDNSGDKSL